MSTAHFSYLIRLADDNLVLAQRYGEWISNGPELEEDIALANIGLDHLGQARALFTHAGEIEGGGRSEDQLAMFRDEREFTNATLVEQPNGDFATTMARALFFDAFQVGLWQGLTTSTDRTLAGIAGRAVKEARYHLRHSSGWVVRLGDGTEESHRRMQSGLDALWPYTHELFAPDEVDRSMVECGIGLDPSRLAGGWTESITAVVEQATLTVPDLAPAGIKGRAGIHTEHLGHILAEMQWLQRSHPGLAW